MDTKAIAKCEIRLAAAEKAVEDLRQWKSFKDFDVAWFTFLSAWKAVYTSLEQGAKGHQKSVQWFGLRNKERRADELLQYLYQARNDDTHGLEEQAAKTPGGVGFGRAIDPQKPFSVRDLSMRTENGVMKISYGSSENFDPAVTVIDPKVSLLPVRDRDRKSGKIYPPPSSHMGQPLEDNTPLAVAELGLRYVQGLVDEAKALV